MALGARDRAFSVIILSFIVLSTSLFFGGTDDVAAAGGDYIRVGLRYGASAPASCTISSAEGFFLGVMADGGFTEGMPLPAYTRLTVSMSGRYVTLSSDGVLISDDMAAGNCLMPYDYADGGLIQYEGVPYRGGLSFFANHNGTFNVINYVPMEEYLYGVLNAEMGRKNPPEALKAQAVAARSYTAYRLGEHAGDGFDLCADTHCQVYKGHIGEYPETNLAVDGTRGLMLYHQGEVVAGYYFKNSGGHTQNSEDVWSGREGYLRGVADEHSPEYAWNWQIPFQTLRAELAASGLDPGEISSVAVTRRSAGGSVMELRIVGSESETALEKERVRTVLGAERVKSLSFSLAGPGGGAAGAPALYAEGLSPSGGTETQGLSGTAHVVSAGPGGEQAVSALGLGDMWLIAASGAQKAVPAQKAETPEAAVSGGMLNFVGRGYGHGVGLPQDSAIAMAEQGYSFEQILGKYYTDVRIE